MRVNGKNTPIGSSSNSGVSSSRQAGVKTNVNGNNQKPAERYTDFSQLPAHVRATFVARVEQLLAERIAEQEAFEAAQSAAAEMEQRRMTAVASGVDESAAGADVCQGISDVLTDVVDDVAAPLVHNDVALNTDESIRQSCGNGCETIGIDADVVVSAASVVFTAEADNAFLCDDVVREDHVLFDAVDTTAACNTSVDNHAGGAAVVSLAQCGVSRLDASPDVVVEHIFAGSDGLVSGSDSDSVVVDSGRGTSSRCSETYDDHVRGVTQDIPGDLTSGDDVGVTSHMFGWLRQLPFADGDSCDYCEQFVCICHRRLVGFDVDSNGLWDSESCHSARPSVVFVCVCDGVHVCDYCEALLGADHNVSTSVPLMFGSIETGFVNHYHDCNCDVDEFCQLCDVADDVIGDQTDDESSSMPELDEVVPYPTESWFDEESYEEFANGYEGTFSPDFGAWDRPALPEEVWVDMASTPLSMRQGLGDDGFTIIESTIGNPTVVLDAYGLPLASHVDHSAAALGHSYDLYVRRLAQEWRRSMRCREVIIRDNWRFVLANDAECDACGYPFCTKLDYDEDDSYHYGVGGVVVTRSMCDKCLVDVADVYDGLISCDVDGQKTKHFCFAIGLVSSCRGRSIPGFEKAEEAKALALDSDLMDFVLTLMLRARQSRGVMAEVHGSGGVFLLGPANIAVFDRINEGLNGERFKNYLVRDI